jgi:hypothetical protein
MQNQNRRLVRAVRCPDGKEDEEPAGKEVPSLYRSDPLEAVE